MENKTTDFQKTENNARSRSNKNDLTEKLNDIVRTLTIGISLIGITQSDLNIGYAKSPETQRNFNHYSNYVSYDPTHITYPRRLISEGYEAAKNGTQKLSKEYKKFVNESLRKLYASLDKAKSEIYSHKALIKNDPLTPKYRPKPQINLPLKLMKGGKLK